VRSAVVDDDLPRVHGADPLDRRRRVGMRGVVLAHDELDVGARVGDVPVELDDVRRNVCERVSTGKR